MSEPQKVYDVFLIDDDACALDLLEAMLESDDNTKYNVFKYSHTPSALNAISAKKPDIVILDINMPIINGLEICQTLKSDHDTQDIMVILMTAYNSKNVQYDGLIKYRADSYVAKPFSCATLLQTIKNIALLREKKLPNGHNSVISNYI